MSEDIKKIKELEKESEKKIFFSGKVYIDRLMKAIEDNRILAFITLALIIIIFMLIVGYISLSKKISVTIDLPPKIYTEGKIGVGMYNANALFYKVWGRYIVENLGNYTPYTIHSKVDEIKYLLSPDFFLKGSEELNALADYAKNNLITHEFMLTEEKIEGPIYAANGIGVTTVGDNLSKVYEKCSYKVKFKISNYRIFVDNLSIKCSPISKEEYEGIRHEHEIANKRKAKGQK